MHCAEHLAANVWSHASDATAGNKADLHRFIIAEAKARRPEQLAQHMGVIKKLSSAAFQYLQPHVGVCGDGLALKDWSVSAADFPRFGKVTSNNVEAEWPLCE